MQFIWKSGLWKVNLPIPGSEKKGTGGKYQVKKEVKYKEFVGTKKQIELLELVYQCTISGILFASKR